jgi:hypothetical protein
MRWLVALLILSGVAFAQSPPEPLSQPKSTEQPTATNKRGTEEVPLIVKVLPTQKAPDDAKHEAEQQSDKSESDWWLVKLTGVLGVMALLQLLAFCWQGIQLKRSVDFMRDEFVTSHRPKLSIRDIRVWQGVDGYEAFNKTTPFEFVAGEKVYAHLTIVNTGDTNAHITCQGAIVYWSKEPLPMVRPYIRTAWQSLDPQPRLLPGQGLEWSGIASIEKMGDEAADITIRREQLIGSAWRLYVMGFVRYCDDREIVRETRFCRVWTTERRFSPIGDIDYDHED